MKTTWDYTDLAESYINRPDYALEAVQLLSHIAGLGQGAQVCDIGAGVAHLTLMLANQEFIVTAVEPNDSMRELGKSRTKSLKKINWKEGTGEVTGLENDSFDLVTFGSSFNVCDRQEALRETHRILRPGGWFACFWNHRDLNNPIQKEIEVLIGDKIPGYQYGTRRDDQRAIIDKSGLFYSPIQIEVPVTHKMEKEKIVEAWRSHATLERQSGDLFGIIVSEIENYLDDLRSDLISVPYLTKVWIARSKGDSKT